MSSAKTIIIFGCVCLAFLTWGLLYSLQPTFYPTKAESVGATPSQYGFVFGIASFASFISSPIFAHFGLSLGEPKTIYHIGGFVLALSGLTFGFLEYVEDTDTFLAISYTLRFMEGVAGAGALTSVLGILITAYPSKVASISALTEGFYSFGYMMGPAVGSCLYSLGGFGLPFFLIGSLAVAIATVQLFVIPKVTEEQQNGYKEIDDEVKESKKPSLTVWTVIKTPFILLPFVDSVICFSGSGMVEGMLESYMKSDDEMNASQTEVAAAFALYGMSYMLMTPIVGVITDWTTMPVLLSLCGNLLQACCFLLIGPSPFLPLSPSVQLVLGMQVLNGVACALMNVSTVCRASRAAKQKGFCTNDIGTSLVITGMWAASFQLGVFTGPTIAGFLVEEWGFRTATVVFFVMYLIMLMVDLIDLFSTLWVSSNNNNNNSKFWSERGEAQELNE